MLTCLYPGKDGNEEKGGNVGIDGSQEKEDNKEMYMENPDENDRSMVLLLECQKQKLLFMILPVVKYEYKPIYSLSFMYFIL